jgi:hypothetical protein
MVLLAPPTKPLRHRLPTENHSGVCEQHASVLQKRATWRASAYLPGLQHPLALVLS